MTAVLLRGGLAGKGFREVLLGQLLGRKSDAKQTAKQAEKRMVDSWNDDGWMMFDDISWILQCEAPQL